MLETVAISAASSAVGLINSDTLKVLAKKLFEAKEDYQVKRHQEGSTLEVKRQHLLEILTDLQTRIVISGNGRIIQKTLPILLGAMISTYEADTEQELKLVDLTLGRIEGALTLNNKSIKRKANARNLAVLVSLIALGILAALIGWGTHPGGPSVDYVLPIIEVPLPILIWSAIGSFTAILYRFNKSGDIEIQDPLRWLFTRPLTGIVMGVIVYFAIKIGLLAAIASGESINVGESEVFWVIAFVGGFSDKFADTVLRALVGQLGGDESDNPVSLEDPTNSDSSLNSLLGNFGLTNQIRERFRSVGETQVHRNKENGNTPESDNTSSERNSPTSQQENDRDTAESSPNRDEAHPNQ